MRQKQGLSLLELLIAIAILVVVLGMASAGVVMALRAQSGQEAVTSSQAKLRRVNEAVLQELRGAVLGGVTSTPFLSGPNSVSFTVIDGGAGYAVQSYTNSQITAVAPAGLATANFEGGQVLLVNSNGIARILTVGSVTPVNGANLFQLNHAACTTAFPDTDDILMFKVRTVGFRYDDAENKLLQRVGNGDELPLAFGMTSFNIDYIYQKDDGSYIDEDDPYLDADTQPDRQGQIGGDNVQLARLNITFGTAKPSFGGRSVSRQYTGQLELLNNVSDNRFRAVRGVSSCSNN